MVFAYFLLIVALGLYSYVLVDPSLTLINNKIWVLFREKVIVIGYFQRELSSILYLVLIILLFLFYLYFIKKSKYIDLLKISLIIALIAIFTYPFLSRDFFNYIFDAKIFTVYHKNPYLFKPLDFPQDNWLRFMNWTHRSYPYGPLFLLISIIPSFLSFNKFILNFLLFKLVFAIFYLLAVYSLSKINKKYAIIFALNPYVIIEGLISPHNDLIGVSLAIAGISLLYKNRSILGRLIVLLSAGIKYTTLPFILLTKNKNKINLSIFILVILMTAYIAYKMDFQPWYFLVIFGFIPFYEQVIAKLNIFFAGLLFSYYPFVRFGEWDSLYKTMMKRQIILIFLSINIIYLFIWPKISKRILKR